MLDQTIYDLNDGKWEEFLTARDTGEKVEITEAMWCYWGDVLPPVRYRQYVTLVTGERLLIDFGFADGAEVITGFWRQIMPDKAQHYFCQLTQEMNEPDYISD